MEDAYEPKHAKIRKFSEYVYDNYISPTSPFLLLFGCSILQISDEQLTHASPACFITAILILLLTDALLESQDEPYIKIISVNSKRRYKSSTVMEEFIEDTIYHLQHSEIGKTEYVFYCIQ